MIERSTPCVEAAGCALPADCPARRISTVVVASRMKTPAITALRSGTVPAGLILCKYDRIPVGSGTEWTSPLACGLPTRSTTEECASQVTPSAAVPGAAGKRETRRRYAALRVSPHHPRQTWNGYNLRVAKPAPASLVHRKPACGPCPSE